MLPVIQNRNVWAAISLIAILLFTSGHMFNHIRKVPYVAGDGRGGVSYFAGGFSSQYGLETQIIAAICRFIDSMLEDKLTCICRRPAIFRHYITGLESTPHSGSKDSASCSLDLGWCYFRYVQFSPQRVSNQERGLPFLATTVLID